LDVRCYYFLFFFSSRRRHTRFSRDWSSDVCSSDLDRLVLTNEPSGEPVQVVTPAVGDAGVDPGSLPARLCPVRSVTPGLAGKLPLRLGEAGAVAALVAGGGDLLPGREGQKGVEPDVDADGRAGGGERLDGRVLAQQGHMPASGRVLGHGHRGRRHALREGAGP